MVFPYKYTNNNISQPNIMKENVKTLKISAVSSVVTMSACAYQSGCPGVLVKSTK